MPSFLYGDSPMHTPEERYSELREMPLAPETSFEQVTTVDLRGQRYRVPLGPDRTASKQFYRDLTWMADEELIFTYDLKRYMPYKSTSTQTTATSSAKRARRTSKYASLLLG
jgi:hypothetical protein